MTDPQSPRALCQVSPWELIRDRAAAKARAVRFVFVKLHQRWLKLRSAGAIRQRGRHSSDEDDARDVRGKALLVAAGWRAGLHVQMPIQGLRDRTGGGDVGNADGSRDSNRSTGSDRMMRSSRLSSDLRSSASQLFSRTVRGEVADPVTRRLLTACNTDWRVQPNAVDVCKAPTAAQVPRRSLSDHAPRTILYLSLALLTSRRLTPPCHRTYIRPRRCKLELSTSNTIYHTFASSSGSTRRLGPCWMQGPPR